MEKLGQIQQSGSYWILTLHTMKKSDATLAEKDGRNE